jgi:hypothetical protein
VDTAKRLCNQGKVQDNEGIEAPVVAVGVVYDATCSGVPFSHRFNIAWKPRSPFLELWHQCVAGCPAQVRLRKYAH